jgi:hypothetical protein
MKKFMALITFFFCSIVLAQTNVSIITYDPLFTPFTDFYASPKLSAISGGRGCTGIADEDGGLESTLLNPASLMVKGFALSAGYNYKSNIDWYSGVKFTAYQPPILAGVGFSLFNKLNFGALYYDRSNFKFVVEIDEATIIREDEGGLPPYVAVDDVCQRTLSFPVSYAPLKTFKMGINVNYSFFSHDFYIGVNNNVFEKTRFELLTADFGLIIKPSDRYSFGLTVSPRYTKQFIKERIYEYSLIADSLWPSEIGGYTIPEPRMNKFPLSAGLGIKYLLSEKIKLFADYHFVNASLYPYYSDRHDINLGVEYLHKKTALRAGAFTLLDFRKTDLWLQESAGKEHQYFLTCGVTQPVGPMEVSLSLMDSHILSSGSLKQTQVSCGLNYKTK